MQSWSILRELFILLVFLGLLYTISYANRDVENAYQMVKFLRREFLGSNDKLGRQSRNNKEATNTQSGKTIDSIKSYWNWLENDFLDRYLTIQTIRSSAQSQQYAYRYKNITQPNRVFGWPVMRQLRVKNGKYCSIHHNSLIIFTETSRHKHFHH